MSFEARYNDKKKNAAIFFVNSSVHGVMVTFLLLLYVRLLKAVSLTFVLHDEEQ